MYFSNASKVPSFIKIDAFTKASLLSKARLLAPLVVFIAAAPVASGADPTDFLGPPQQHRVLHGDMPPGAIGGARLSVAGPGVIPGYYQPVSFQGPEGTQFALSSSNTFLESSAKLQAGLLVGSVYRFKITSIPGYQGAELFPTIEVIDRTYPPPGLATRYPIVVHIDRNDLIDALDGRLVTRVVYLEDPQTASPLPQTKHEQPIEASHWQDALEIADRFGRPVAILRMGSVAPPETPVLMPRFFFGSPPWLPIEQAAPVSSTTPTPPHAVAPPQL